MATFPVKEADILVLAQSLAAGLTAHPDLLPAPPVSAATLESLINDYVRARQAAAAALADAHTAVTAKDKALTDFKAAIKSNLRYAEITASPDQLALLGWSPRRKPSNLQPPAQCGPLNINATGPGWLKLTWTPPADGGRVAAYIVQRRTREQGDWHDIATSLKPEANLVDQPRGQTLEFRVIAVNKAGQSLPGNITGAVL